MQTCCLLSLIKQTNKHIAYENQPNYTDEPWEKVLLYLRRISQKTLLRRHSYKAIDLKTSKWLFL